jgi:hypothetical protein
MSIAERILYFYAQASEALLNPAGKLFQICPHYGHCTPIDIAMRVRIATSGGSAALPTNIWRPTRSD